jgi:hypothetical protein
MKTVFSKKYLMENKGCYTKNDVKSIPCYNSRITLKKLHNEIPIKDFIWFLIYKCELTTKQQQILALECAKLVLPNYEKFALEDDRVRKCIEATEKYINGEISKDDLCSARLAARSAESAARSARLAARSAWLAAESAESAARSARLAAESAESAARSAWLAAQLTESAESAARSAWLAAQLTESAEFKKGVWGIVKNLTKGVRDGSTIWTRN